MLRILGQEAALCGLRLQQSAGGSAAEIKV